MRLSLKKISFAVVPALALSFAAFQVFRINQTVQKKLADERARLTGNRVPFEKKWLSPPQQSQKARVLQNARAASDFVEYLDSYFAATGGGLVQFSADGVPLRHFTVLDGLPESDLTCLAVYAGRLFIGTRTKDLVAFDGERFEHFAWTDRQSRAVTSLLEADGRLLVGTMAGGLLEFDGRHFAEITAEKKRIAAVNFLARDGAKIYVGTFDDGLWVYGNPGWSHFTTARGLPSNRVVGIAAVGEKLFAATDFGLAVLEAGSFRTLSVMPALSSLARRGGELYLSKAGAGVYVFDGSLKPLGNTDDLRSERLVSRGERLWLLTDEGVAEVREKLIRPFASVGKETLTDNFVSAMTFDGGGNLWLGTFRRGIDVFSPGGKKLRHLETDVVREINYLASEGGKVSAATSGGLVSFGTDFSQAEPEGKDKLPGRSVAHFTGAHVATAKGLALREKGKVRLLSTVQGLPNNSVYTTLRNGPALFAGTLGGLAKVENGRVTQTFRDSNSNLTTNWVTALLLADERFFIGTYGGGVFELLPSGEVRSFEPETGKFAVNPNALFSDGERLYAGTLDGVRTLDLRTRRWAHLRDLLPAPTVLSVAGSDEHIYFGTTGGVAIIEKSYFAGEER